MTLAVLEHNNNDNQLILQIQFKSHHGVPKNTQNNVEDTDEEETSGGLSGGAIFE